MIPRKRPRLLNLASENSTASLSTTGSTGKGSVASLSKGNSTFSSTAQSQGMMSPINRDRSHSNNHGSGSGSGSGSSNINSNINSPAQVSKSQAHKTRSWYGSWSGKSQASIQLATENITGGTSRPDATPNLSRFETKKTSEASSESDVQTVGTGALALPKITENGTNSTNSMKATQPTTEQQEQREPTSQPSIHNGDSTKNDQKEDGPKTDNEEQTVQPATAQPPPTTSSGWLGWLGYSTTPTTPASTTGESANQHEPPKETETTPEINPSENTQPLVSGTATPPSDPPKPEPPKPEPPIPKQPSSWFGLWSSNTPVSPNVDAQGATNHEPVQSIVKNPSEDVVMEDAPPSAPSVPTTPSTPSAPASGSQPSAGSTWAFWSRDSGSKSSGKTPTTAEQGELAIIGEGSESRPRRSTSVEISENTTPENKPPGKPAKESGIRAALSKKSKRARPQSMDLDESSTPRPGTPQSDASSVKNIAVKPAPQPSLLLPSFKSTYHMKENPSIIKQITQLLLRSQQPPANHVFLTKEPPKIRRAIAIGVHGLFPASYLRPMIGQPTGTSIRFMNHCAEAIRRWAESHGCGDIEIEKVALEGEGKIFDRVDNLWKLLLNWIEHIRRADLIVIGCHSQGVPVTMMLVAKLIELGVINGARLGICAMAGVSLGPFPDYKSSMGMLMGSAAELWQFADPESEVSKRYEHALQTVVNHGARITFVGSIDDQLVPLESALMSPASHPYIYRAVFIDARVHAPDFISHLVGFALKLRNLGISDHGLIRELSIPLAGSLYGGEGHSRLYDDQQVYDLAVSHALETTSVGNVPCHIRKHEGLANPNPYVLPWIMRGLLEEQFVKTELYSETTELLRQFDEWKPVTKALKDVKYRLEAVKSKL